MKNKKVMLLNIAHNNFYEARELRGLFEKQLKELYWTENSLSLLLGDSILYCTSKDLIIALENQLGETISHKVRLEKIFEAIGITPSLSQDESMKCMIGEIQHITGVIKAGVVRDAGIIAVLQKIKHYEIACYGTMRAYAIALREEDVVTLLQQTLEEEKTADQLLSYIAESHINIEAADKEI